MDLTIEKLVQILKDVFGATLVKDESCTYEKLPEDETKLKLVLFLNQLFYEQTAILYTKLIFVVDVEKIKVVQNSFLYLYDINCQYKPVEFEDGEDLRQQLKTILRKEKFGPNILILSEFVKSPAALLNNWFQAQKIKDLSVLDLQYDPKINIIPCKSLFFSFTLQLNNQAQVEFTLTKERAGKYIYAFHIYDETISVEESNLNNLVAVIGDTLKNNFLK